MNSRYRMVLSLFFCMIAVASVHADDLALAPENFAVSGGQAVFVDFTTAEIDLRLDVPQRKATAKVAISFYQPHTGYPLLDLVPNISKLDVDGQEISPSLFKQVRDPEQETHLRIIEHQLSPGHHTATITYTLNSTNLSFSSQGVKLGLFMSDLSRRRFLEQYFPANLEYDACQTSMRIEIIGAGYQHRIMSNGEVRELGNHKFTVAFPNYFTTSSYYLHIVNPSEMTILEADYQGIEARIPLLVYAKSQSLATRGMTDLKKFMKELENTFGAYGHAKFVAYITSGGGGMEHCGATVTSLWALGHEVTHSWFARGVMPNSGNSGWMDEAIASWRDRGYPRPSKLVDRPTVNMAGYSQYRRYTSRLAYTKGMTFISELDYIFRDQGGMRKRLREFFAINKRKAVTTEIFQQYLQNHSHKSLQQNFERYVFGKDIDDSNLDAETISVVPICRPYTTEELKEIL